MFKCQFSFGIFEYVFMASWLNEMRLESLCLKVYGLIAHALLFFFFFLMEMLEVVCVLCLDSALEFHNF